MHTILIYSGGLDSTTLLYQLLHDGHQVSALGIDYGQRHRRELHAARLITDRLLVPFRIANLSSLKPFLAGSSQTDDTVTVPLGHYADESMKATVVPNRNMLMLSVALAWAISLKAKAVAYAAHSGDHPIYPDCRPAFVDAMAAAARLCDWHELQLLAPFLSMSKADIVTEGARLGVPFADTWSCYQGGDRHCGQCGTCVERKEAFQLAGVKDTTLYVDATQALRV